MMKIIIMLGVLVVSFTECKAQMDLPRIRENITQARAVIVAEVTTIGAKPGFWSGQFAAFQDVHYRVIESLKGSIASKDIAVRHPVVKNSETADALSPQLSPRLFSRHSRVILFLSEIERKDFEENDGCFLRVQFKTQDEHVGVVSVTDELLSFVRKELSVSKKR